MPREDNWLKEVGTPDEWMKRAQSNLVRARQPKPEEVFFEDLVFDIQQSVEKALKALLLKKGIRFRFVHDIAELLTLLEQNEVALPDEIRAAADLTDYAVQARYPGPFEPVSENEYTTALDIANAVLAWVTKQLLAEELTEEQDIPSHIKDLSERP
ncbi:MAG: HEPN domain-containing protein [bacterium]|nr:HEPN domain-containing protein [bacterium]